MKPAVLVIASVTPMSQGATAAPLVAAGVMVLSRLEAPARHSEERLPIPFLPDTFFFHLVFRAAVAHRIVRLGHALWWSRRLAWRQSRSWRRGPGSPTWVRHNRGSR
jgi:hypothetical protein